MENNEAVKCTACGGEIENGACKGCGMKTEETASTAETMETPTE